MKKFYLLLSLSIFFLYAQAQEYGLHFMREVWNAQYTNPGFMPRQTVVVSLPSIYSTLNITGINHTDVLQKNSADNKYYFNYGGILDGLERDVNLKLHGGIEALALGFRSQRFFFSGSTNTRIAGEINVPEALLGLFWEGSPNYLDETLEIAPEVNTYVYRETGLGVNYSLTPRLFVGARIKRLSGIFGFQTDKSSLQIHQSSEYYQTRIEADYLINYYAAGLIEPIEEEGKGLNDFEDELSGASDTEASQHLEDGDIFGALSSIPKQNGGWAVDLGAEMILNERLTVSAALLDLGSIRWSKGVQQLRIIQESTTFEGLSLAALAPEESDLDVSTASDSLSNNLSVSAQTGQSFVQGLAPRSYLSATYEVNPFLSVGGLLHNEFGRYRTFTALALNARLNLGRVFSLGGTYAIQSRTFNSLGLNAALKLGPVQLYSIVDNMAPLWRPSKTSGAHFRLGLNLVFGRKKMDALIAQARLPEGEIQEGEAEVMASTDSQIPPDEENLPTATEVNPIAEEGPANPESSTYALDLYFFDEETRITLDAVHVDVFRKGEPGNSSLVRTGRHSNGHMSIRMEPSNEPHEARVSAFGYQEIVIPFTPSIGRPIEKYWYMRALEAPHPLEEEGYTATSPPQPETAADNPTPAPLPEKLAGAAAVNDPASLQDPQETMDMPLGEDERVGPGPNANADSQHLILEFHDQATRGRLEAVYVDIYQISETGKKELMRTARYPEGEMTLQLPEEKANYELVASAYGYESKALRFSSHSVSNLSRTVFLKAEDSSSSQETPTPSNEVAHEPATGTATANVMLEELEEPQAPLPQKDVKKQEKDSPRLQLKVTQRTSLREKDSSQSTVLQRLSEETVVELLEETNVYWWKVTFQGQTGWVKKALLQKVEN